MTSLRASAPPELRNRIVLPGDDRYRLLRSTYTTVASPAAVLLPETTAQVVTALRHAREQDLPLSVRSGGHGLSGRSSNDGGLVIDLSAMNRVKVLDRARRLVRVEAGARWAHVARALAPYGLAISSGDHGNVGAGGLATGGGIGWLARHYGLTIDHIRAAEVVLADGTVVRLPGPVATFPGRAPARGTGLHGRMNPWPTGCVQKIAHRIRTLGIRSGTDRDSRRERTSNTWQYRRDHAPALRHAGNAPLRRSAR